jgi:beta-glucanase (GH16 family)
MISTKTKSTSLFALTLAAVLVTGCLPEDKKDPGPTPDPDVDFYEENGWELVFADEFEGTTLDSSKWAYEVNCWGGGNDESQCYVEDPDNVFVEDGVLTIRAIREEHTGAELNPDSPEYDPAVTKTRAFTSGRLRTVDPVDYVEGQDPAFHMRNDWKYGRIEIRAKVPAGQGTWAAAWMLPTDYEFGGWAMSGEIDILEAVNIGAESDADDAVAGQVENRVYGTLHYGRAWPGNEHSGESYSAINPAADFHTYTIEWEEGAMRWFVDDVHFATQTKEGWYTHFQDENGDWQTSGTTDAPFNQNFHIILNLAMGGAWAGNVNEGGIDDSINQADYLVDYVRVYQCEDDATGVACGTKGEEGTYTLNSGVVEPLLPVAADFTADPLVIFDDLLVADWQIAKWDDADGGDEYEAIEATDTSDGYIDLKFDNTGVMYLYSNEGKVDDFSEFAGNYNFEIRWVDGTATALKVGFSNADGDFAYIDLDQQYFGVQGADDWTSVSIPVSDMVANSPGFNFTNVNIPGKFEQVGGTDLNVQVKNLNITKGEIVVVEPTPMGFKTELLSTELAAGYSILNFWDGSDGGETITVDAGVVAVAFTGVGNMGLSSASTMDLSDFVEDGMLNFSLKVTDLGTASDLVIKLDSGYPNVAPVNLTTYNGGTLVVDGDFVSYSIPISDFVSAGQGDFDIASIVNPLVLEPVGSDLQFEFKDVNFERSLSILDSELNAGFSIQNFWDGSDGGESIGVDSGVVSVAFTGIGNMGVSSTDILDLSSFVDSGNLNIDLKVTDLGSATDLVIKLDSGYPNVAPVNLTAYNGGTLVVNGDFVSFAIPVSDFVAAGQGEFDIASIVNPLVLEPSGSDLQFEFRSVSFSH